MRGPRDSIRHVLIALVVAGAAAGVYGCRTTARMEARHRVLEAERDALIGYLDAADAEPTSGAGGGIVPFHDVLVVVRPSLIDALVEASLPLERDLSDDIHVRLDSASIALRPGIAIARLDGRVSLAGRGDVRADVRLLGVLELAPRIEAERGLVATIAIYDVEARDVSLGGLAPPAERLVEEFARFKIGELNRSLGALPIPVRLDEQVSLPLVEESELTIPAYDLPLAFGLGAVRVLEDGMYVSLSIDRTLPGWGVILEDR
ncbi:MAG: hypothetical protein R3195_03875 [Gemmatimonadota bacterium]|nr:hypothetical protein [Gemmatimonadota bacterium]